MNLTWKNRRLISAYKESAGERERVCDDFGDGNGDVSGGGAVRGGTDKRRIEGNQEEMEDGMRDGMEVVEMKGDERRRRVGRNQEVMEEVGMQDGME